MTDESYEERAKRQNRERQARFQARRAKEAPLKHPGEAVKRMQGVMTASSRPGHSSRCQCAVCRAK
jgi:hypothetical protein